MRRGPSAELLRGPAPGWAQLAAGGLRCRLLSARSRSVGRGSETIEKAKFNVTTEGVPNCLPSYMLELFAEIFGNYSSLRHRLDS